MIRNRARRLIAVADCKSTAPGEPAGFCSRRHFSLSASGIFRRVIVEAGAAGSSERVTDTAADRAGRRAAGSRWLPLRIMHQREERP